MYTTREPLRGNDADGAHAGISLVLEKCPPRSIKHGTKSIYMEKFLVQWDPQECTLHEAQQQ